MSQIEGYTHLFIFSEIFSSYPLLFEPTRLLIFKKTSSLLGISYTQIKKFPSYLLLLEPTRLLDFETPYRPPPNCQGIQFTHVCTD